MEFEKLLEKLTKAVSYTYATDSICPGVLFSTLKNGSVYASIVRYGNQFDHGKLVVCKVRASDHIIALTGLTQEFLSLSVPIKNPVDELSDFWVDINETDQV